MLCRTRPIPGSRIVASFLLILSLFSAGSSPAQTVYRVDADAPPGGDGSSWMQAFDDLADALAVAAAQQGPVEVWVAEGTYRADGGTFEVERAFDLPSDTRLLGGFAGDETSADERDPAAHPTVLSGDLLGDDLPGWQQRDDNSRQILRAQDLSLPSEVDGFTLTGGNADFVPDDFLGGGAIFVERSELAVSRCVFVENTAGTTEPTLGNFGGALYVKDSGIVTVDACRFERNRANAGGAIGAVEFGGRIDLFVSDTVFDENDVPTQSGGAIRFVGRALIIERSEFTDQHAGYAGAMHTTLAERVEIRDCVFARNVVDVKSAALWLDRSDNADATPLILERCVFEDNWTDGGFRGGTIHLDETITHMTACTFRGNFNVRVNPITSAIEGSGTVTVEFESGHEFRNCLFANNIAGFVGGLELIQAQAVSTNCTFVDNRSASPFPAASGIALGTSTLEMANTILWNNRVGVGVDDELSGAGGESAQISLFNSALSIDHSLVEGWSGVLGGVGNVGEDPLFVDEASGDLRLMTGSPAIDSGDNAAVPPDLLLDLDGNPRILDGDGDEIAVVDMGAYEFDGVVVDVDASPVDFADGLELFPARLDGPLVELRYRLDVPADVSLSIFDVRGRRLRDLVDERQPGGEHRIRWEGTTRSGTQVGSGVYFVRLEAAEAVRTNRFVLLR